MGNWDRSLGTSPLLSFHLIFLTLFPQITSLIASCQSSHLSLLTSQITVAALGPTEGHLNYNPLHADMSLMVY